MLQQQEIDPGGAGPAPEPEQAPQPRGQAQGSPYDGMTATNPRTGQRVVYRTQGGRGRWVQISPENAPEEARAALENERSNLARLRQTGRLADDFLEHNQERGTGGWFDQPGMEWAPQFNTPHRDAMRGLTDQMVRGNIRPGMAQTMNSDAEALMARGEYPNLQTHSYTNMERAVRIRVARDMQVELVAEMEGWLRQNPSLAGFEQYWRTREPVLREQLTRLHADPYRRILNERGLYGGREGRDEAPPSRRQPADEAWRRDPRTGEIRRVR